MRKTIIKLKNDPIGFVIRVLRKTIIDPVKYGKHKDYDARKYWDNRLSKYGLSIKGSGDEGLSIEENERTYESVAEKFLTLCKKWEINFQQSDVLEIGCGSGFYTQLLYRMGVISYVGVDITDTLFLHHQERFPSYEFKQKDITVDTLNDKYDVIIMIDVIEHIVNDEKFSFAMNNIKNSLKDTGIFIVSPVLKKNKKHLFYVRHWTLEDVISYFEGYVFSEPVPFRDGHIIAVRKQESLPCT